MTKIIIAKTDILLSSYVAGTMKQSFSVSYLLTVPKGFFTNVSTYYVPLMSIQLYLRLEFFLKLLKHASADDVTGVHHQWLAAPVHLWLSHKEPVIDVLL